MSGVKTGVAGLGFRSAATTASLRAALNAAMAHGTGALHLTALATAADKANAVAFMQLAVELNLPTIAVPLAQLTSHNAAPSTTVPARYGHRSLAESSALAAAGPGARLVAPRSPSPDGMATAALAENTKL